jgi:hypothetical protein
MSKLLVNINTLQRELEIGPNALLSETPYLLWRVFSRIAVS